MFLCHCPVSAHETEALTANKDENDIAKDIVCFLQQFLKVFPALKGKKLYLSGESVSSTFVLMLIC